MNLKPHHLAIIKAVAYSGACSIRADGRDCAPVLLLFNSTPAGEIGELAGHVAEQPDRTEVLLVSAMSATEQWLLVAKIDGRNIAPAEFERVDDGQHAGRFIRQAQP